jgi:hypothetical protein
MTVVWFSGRTLHENVQLILNHYDLKKKNNNAIKKKTHEKRTTTLNISWSVLMEI